MSQITQVILVGGTHGNERIGIYLIKRFNQHPSLIKRSSFTTQTLLSNPKAVAAGVRYLDKDLNRCFNRDSLRDMALTSYEDLLAKAIDQQIGPHGQTPADVIVDLHSTTANMGLTLILNNENSFNLQLAAYLHAAHPLVKIYSAAHSGRNQDSLRSLARFSVGIEVGSVAQGVLDAQLFCQTEALIYTILDYLEAHNQNKLPATDRLLTLYRYLKAIAYPQTAQGELQALIHPQLQFKDYEPLNCGDPMFLTFEGETITYQGEAVFPIFINEAAYYEKNIALILTQKTAVQS